MKLRLPLMLASAAIGLVVYSNPANGLERQPQSESRLVLAQPRQLTPRQYLYVSAGATEAVALDRIITCESAWNPNAKNRHSTATGLGQFLASTWLSTRKSMGRDTSLELRTDYKESIDTIVYLHKRHGTSPWLESSRCWKQTKRL